MKQLTPLCDPVPVESLALISYPAECCGSQEQDNSRQIRKKRLRPGGTLSVYRPSARGLSPERQDTAKSQNRADFPGAAEHDRVTDIV